MQNISNKITVLINYLLIVYTFLLPFNVHLSTTVLHTITILYIFSGNIKEKLLFAIKNRLIQAIFLFFAMYLLWTLDSTKIDIILWKLNQYKYLFYTIIFVTIIQDIFKEEIKLAFLVSIFISEMTSLIMFAGYKVPFFEITGFGRYVPFFYTYSQYSLLIIISVGLSSYSFFTTTSNIKKAFYIVLFFTSTFIVFILDSKSAYILYFITIFIVVYNVFHLRKKIFFIFTGFVLIINILAFAFSSTFHKRVSNIYTQSIYAVNSNIYTGSTGARIGINLVGFELFLQKPIIGHGTQEHIPLAIKAIEDMNVSQEQKNQLLVFKNPEMPGMQTLHNEYLDYLIQFGLIGLFIFLNIFYSLYKLRIQKPQWKVLNTILLINFMLYMFSNYFFILNQLGEIFLILISLTLTTYYNNNIRNKTI
jgi:O-antigen ligase